MPAAWKNSASSMANGALPETNIRSLPPKRALILENTSRSATTCSSLSNGPGPFPACFNLDTSIPTRNAQRQPEVLHVVGAEEVELFDRLRLVDPAVVDQLHALGAPGGAGGVDQHRQGVLAHRPRVALVRLRVGLVRLLAQRLQVRQRDHP